MGEIVIEDGLMTGTGAVRRFPVTITILYAAGPPDIAPEGTEILEIDGKTVEFTLLK